MGRAAYVGLLRAPPARRGAADRLRDRALTRTVIPPRFLRATLAAWLLAAPAAVAAQEPAARPRIGVALSGGGAKGFAHIGVLRVLEEAGIPVDLVTGTSIGAAVGGLYAIGYGPAALDSLATGQDWTRLFSDATERRYVRPDLKATQPRTLFSLPIEGGSIQLPSGLVGGQNISQFLSRLAWHVHRIRDLSALPIPFAAVATDLTTGHAVRLTEGFLPDAIRASMAIPTAFEPVRLDGRLLIDGGIARNLPAEDVRALGADVVICSDVAEPLASAAELTSLVDVLLQTIAFQMTASTDAQRALCDVVVHPDVAGFSSTSFTSAGPLIRRGEAAARAALPELRRWADAQRAAAVRRERERTLAAASDTAHFDRLDVVGASPPAERLVRAALDLPDAGTVTPDALAAATQRVYATGLFERVGYRLSPEPGVVRIDIGERNRDRIGLGFRYDGHYRASLLFAAEFHNLLRFGSTAILEARLAEQTVLRLRYNAGTAGGLVRLGLAADWLRAPLDVYDGDRRVAELTVEARSLMASAAAVVPGGFLAGLQVKGEVADFGASTAAIDTAGGETFYSVAALLWRDSFDHTSFPDDGSALQVRVELADRAIGGGATFRRYIGEFRRARMLGAKLNVSARLTTGLLAGDDVPAYYLFTLGGAYPYSVFPENQLPFLGLRPQQRAGTAVQLGYVALRYEVRDGLYATAAVNAGAVGGAWQDLFEDYLFGAGFSLGARTPIGPLELTASGMTLREWPRLELNIGHYF
jgi:NTE family protein